MQRVFESKLFLLKKKKEHKFLIWHHFIASIFSLSLPLFRRTAQSDKLMKHRLDSYYKQEKVGNDLANRQLARLQGEF